MLAIIPIFLDDEKDLWHSKEGLNVISQSLTTANNAKLIEKLIVCTNDGTILDLSRTLNVEAYIVKNANSDQVASLLPAGYHSSFQYIDKVLKLQFDDLLVLSFRNPLISPNIIDNAIKEFEKKDSSSIISVVESEDHPCQLNAYYKIIDAGLIHLFDYDKLIPSHLQSTDNGKYMITKPFYFDWRLRGIYEKSKTGLYTSVNNGVNIRYKPCNSVGDTVINEDNNHLWVYENSHEARIIINLNSRELKNIDLNNMQIMGASSFDDYKDISSVFYVDAVADASYIMFYPDNSILDSCILRLLPIEMAGLLKKESHGILISDLSQPVHFQCDVKNVTGIVYSILKVAEDDTYDISEPFVSMEELWSKNTGSTEALNMRTGKVITGRQDFPETLEPDGSFFLLHRESFGSFDDNLLNGNVDGFVLDRTNSIQIRTTIDMLRYKAILKERLS